MVAQNFSREDRLQPIAKLRVYSLSTGSWRTLHLKIVSHRRLCRAKLRSNEKSKGSGEKDMQQPSGFVNCIIEWKTQPETNWSTREYKREKYRGQALSSHKSNDSSKTFWDLLWWASHRIPQKCLWALRTCYLGMKWTPQAHHSSTSGVLIDDRAEETSSWTRTGLNIPLLRADSQPSYI